MQPTSSKKQRVEAIIATLARLYPNVVCSLNWTTPVQLLVATMLSAQCTDERVNRVTPELFKRFPNAEALADAELQELEILIRSTGFYRNKAKNIRAACQKIVQEFDGKVPATMEQLLTLPGVARKTANVVLAHAFGKLEGVTVDTHVSRLSQRLGLTEQTNPIKIEQDLMELIPQPQWENFSLSLIYHGRAVCKARTPRCEVCALSPWCPAASRLAEVQ